MPPGLSQVRMAGTDECVYDAIHFPKGVVL